MSGAQIDPGLLLMGIGLFLLQYRLVGFVFVLLALVSAS